MEKVMFQKKSQFRFFEHYLLMLMMLLHRQRRFESRIWSKKKNFILHFTQPKSLSLAFLSSVHIVVFFFFFSARFKRCPTKQKKNQRIPDFPFIP